MVLVATGRHIECAPSLQWPAPNHIMEWTRSDRGRVQFRQEPSET
jgi:hypothetical protein